MPIVYRFGVKRPTVNEDLVREQMMLGNDYGNELRRHETTRRNTVREVLVDRDAQIQPLLDEAQELRWELVAAEDAAKAKRKETRSKSETKAQKAELKVLREKVKAKKAEVTAARKTLKLTEEQQAMQAAARAKYEAREKTEGVISADLYSGTRRRIQAAMDATQKAPLWSKKTGKPSNPRWRRWTGEGSVDVEIGEARRLPVENTLKGEGTYIQFKMEPEQAGMSKTRKKRKRGIVRMRVGSDSSRKPIWAEWPVLMHRPLPPASVISFAKIACNKIADREEWSLYLTLNLSKDEEEKRKATHGVGSVAMDLGWRKYGKNDMRVAYFLDDQGRAIDFRIEPEILAGFRKVEDLISIRKQAMNKMSGELRAWIKENEAPAWLRERTRYMWKWESRERFLGLLSSWKKNRWLNDEHGFNLLDIWAYGAYNEETGRREGGDRHLWQWERSQAKKSLRRRKDQYRRIAAQLSTTNRVLVVEDINLQTLKRKKEVGEEAVHDAAKYQQQVAACGELRAQVIQAFQSRGGQVFKVDPAYTSQRCSRCGVIRKANRQGAMYTCECGNIMDADENAAKNILALFRDSSKVTEVKVKKRKPKWVGLKEKKAKKEAENAVKKETARKPEVIFV